jgi:hypothetical protein
MGFYKKYFYELVILYQNSATIYRVVLGDALISKLNIGTREISAL